MEECTRFGRDKLSLDQNDGKIITFDRDFHLVGFRVFACKSLCIKFNMNLVKSETKTAPIRIIRDCIIHRFT